MNSWLLCGPIEHWQIALKHSIWGFRDVPRFKGWKDEISLGDPLAFYVMAPVSGIIGYGEVASRCQKDDTLVWPHEKETGKPIYVYKFKISAKHVVNEQEWKSKAVKLSEAGLPALAIAGLNSVRKEWFESLIATAKRKWGLEALKPLSEHDSIKQMIADVGTLQDRIAETETALDKMRIDVVWKKVEKGAPYVAFEVQIGGSLSDAMIKLKHAWDIWNSIPVLVTTEEYEEKAKQLLEGAFHEIRDVMKIVSVGRIKELHELKKRLSDLESALGIY